MDVISYFCAETRADNIPLILRGIVLALIAAMGYAASESKKVYHVTALVLILHASLHLSFAAVMGADGLMSDAANLIRIYSFPITTVAFVSFIKKEPSAADAIEKGFFIALFTIVFIEIASVITQTDPHSYPNKELGMLGWFYFANSQSAIISMIYPVVIFHAHRKYGLKASAVTLTAGSAALYFLATRLAYFALVFTLTALLFTCLYLWTRKSAPLKKESVALTLALAAAILASGFSPMAKNLHLTGQNATLKQEHIDALAAEGGTRAVYSYYLPTLVDRFGYERTYRLYGGSTDVDDVCDVRRMKIAYCRLLTEDSPLFAVAGHPIGEMTYGGKNHDVENDFHGIFYLTGAVGLSLLLAFFLYFARRILRCALRRKESFISLKSTAYLLSLTFGLMHAYFTAGVLRRPNASFYLALTLALIYSLTKNKPKGSSYDER